MKNPDDSTPPAAKAAASSRAATPPTRPYDLTWDNGWSIISRPKSPRHASTGTIGSLGLWKSPLAGRIIFFAYPDSILSNPANATTDDFLDPEDEAFETHASIQQAILEWSLSTASGKLPAGWTSPSAEWLVDLFPKNCRFIRHGSILRDIELVHEPEQLALRVVLASVDDALPEQRRRWLEKFVASANANWRLVRIGFAPDSRSVVAEVNLTGAPAAVLRPLFQTALDSLRWVVSGLAETTDFLARGESPSQALEVLSAG